MCRDFAMAPSYHIFVLLLLSEQCRRRAHLINGADRSRSDVTGVYSRDEVILTSSPVDDVINDDHDEDQRQGVPDDELEEERSGSGSGASPYWSRRGTVNTRRWVRRPRPTPAWLSMYQFRRSSDAAVAMATASASDASSRQFMTSLVTIHAQLTPSTVLWSRFLAMLALRLNTCSVF